jgi:hypothetical protein
MKEDVCMKKVFLFIIFGAFSISAYSQIRIGRQKTREEILNETYCTGLFATLDADYFDFLDDRVSSSAMGYLNVLDWLQGRVAGLQIYNAKYNRRIPFIRNQRAGVFIDEMLVDYDFLSMLPVSDIAMIKVIKGPFSHPWGGSGGTIAIYTIRGDEEEEIRGVD